MEGKLGGLYDGEQQIGGILDWILDLVLTDSTEGKFRTYKFSKWKLIAQSYWLFDEPSKVIVRLFNDVGKGYWEGKGIISSNTQKVLDTLIHEPIELIGEGTLEGKE